jgi:hypothetical protein
MAFHVEPTRVAFTRRYTAMPYNAAMYSIIETAVFQRYAAEIWQDAEREAFIVWLANNPLAGAVIPGSGGLRKVRWTTQRAKENAVARASSTTTSLKTAKFGC